MTGHSFIERSRYYLACEYPAKIRIAVESLPDEIIWRRPAEESNSIGNLLLHLSGNIRQWIVGGVGGAQTERDRASEFAARGGSTGRELVALLDRAVADADEVLAGLSESQLSEPRTIQGRETTVIGAVYHVVEHFSTHTGQVLMLAKIFAPGSVKFYEDAGGVAVPLWGGSEGLS
ncbi:MAG: DinB family protein [Gemmatimonadaceae bacterium]